MRLTVPATRDGICALCPEGDDNYHRYQTLLQHLRWNALQKKIILTKSSLLHPAWGPEYTSCNCTPCFCWPIGFRNHKKYWKTTKKELIFKKFRVLNQQLCLRTNSPIDILGNFAYFLQTPLNGCFQTECMK